MNGSRFLMVAFCARRPKILNPQQDHIEVKFNESLFSHARLLQEIGVKVFAGVPLISNLKQLNSDSPCSFFSISPNGKECILQLNKTDASADRLPSGLSKVEPSEILASINDKQTYHYWDQFIEADRKGRHNRHFPSRKGVYGQMYKPVYFLIPALK